MTLELANRSVRHPMGIAEDVVVRVDGFTFLADFVVVNFEPDPRVPIILGRPFLRTAKALIDLYEEKLTLRVRSDELVFYAEKSEKSKNKQFAHAISVIDFSKDEPFSGSTTNHSDALPPSSSSVKTSEILEEFADELTLLKKDVHFQVYSNPLFEFDDNFTYSNVNPLFNKMIEDVENKNSNVSDSDELVLLNTPLSDKVECSNPEDDIDEINVFLAMEVSSNFEEGYFDSEGDVTFLENLLSDDTTHNLAPEVISDHEPKQDESIHNTSITFSPRSDPLHHEFAGELITLPSRTVRKHEEYLNLSSSLIPLRIDDPVKKRSIYSSFQGDLIPPGVENDDSKDEDNSTFLPEHEFPTLDHQETPVSSRLLRNHKMIDPKFSEDSRVRCFVPLMEGKLAMEELPWTFTGLSMISQSYRTPIDTESKLGADGDPVSDPTLYRSLAGSLQFLTFTRPDMSYAVQQPTLSRSIAEAEYCGVANAVAETCLRNLLRELHTFLCSAMLVYCDNVSAVYLSCNPVQHQCTKHIEIDIYFVRDLVAAGQVRVLHVPSRYHSIKGLQMDLVHDDRANIIGEEDRLSNLPDDIIHHILSYLDMKYVVQTCTLSKRWKHAWTSITYLMLHGDTLLFRSLTHFSRFVKHALSHRNKQTEAEVKLTFTGPTNHSDVRSIINDVCLHNVRQLTMTWFSRSIHEFPPFLFSSHTLKHLTLNNQCHHLSAIIRIPKSVWDLPALETLYLSYMCIDFCREGNGKSLSLFSKCVNLKDLTFHKCYLDALEIFNVPKLFNLSITNSLRFPKAVNLVAPHLRNLTATVAPVRHKCTTNHHLHLSTEGLNSLETVNLSLPNSRCDKDIYVPVLLNMFKKFSNAKDVILDVYIIEVYKYKL
ncbi:F-box domain, cyclin-like protein [Tanacetum coccineum]